MQRSESLLSWHAHIGQVYATQFSLDETSVLSMGIRWQGQSNVYFYSGVQRPPAY